MTRSIRQPVWSDRLTLPLATRIGDRDRLAALRAIKAIHTTAFFLISGCILIVAWDGIRGRAGRRAPLAAAVALAEVVVYGSNNQVCPLTPLAEELGAASGSVTDLYLPRSISDRIPLFGSATLVIGLAFHARHWWAGRTA